MISYPVYKIVHLFGVFMVLSSLGAIFFWHGNGGSRNPSWRRQIALTHGIGMLLAIVGGFGLLARLGLAKEGLPGWIWAKLGIWLLLGGAVALAPRLPKHARSLWWGILLSGGIAAWLAGYKPF